MSGLPVVPAHQLAIRSEEQRWLIESLWADEAVGIVGGEPKCCKSFLALDMAVSVATGKPCLRRFAVPHPGPVLLYAAEDAAHVVRQRLDGICHACDVPIADLDVNVITSPALRLDLEVDSTRLEETVAALRPRLLVLDPFVRLHRIDENISGEVAPLLAYLRELQRRHHCAVVLVHHARKGAARVRAGQALRGSSEFHAWGDSNLYMRRVGEELALTVEQRASASVPRIALELCALDNALALTVVEPETLKTPDPAPSSAQLIERALADASTPLSLRELRATCRIRTATLSQLLGELVAKGLVERTPDGFAAR